MVQVIRHGLKKIQYQPGFIEGCLAGTGLTLDQIEHSTDTTNKGLLGVWLKLWLLGMRKMIAAPAPLAWLGQKGL